MLSVFQHKAPLIMKYHQRYHSLKKDLLYLAKHQKDAQQKSQNNGLLTEFTRSLKLSNTVFFDIDLSANTYLCTAPLDEYSVVSENKNPLEILVDFFILHQEQSILNQLLTQYPDAVEKGFTALCQSGLHKRLEIHVRMEVDSHSNPLKISGTLRDISQIYNEKERLSRSSKRLHDFFENARIGIYRTTPEGEFIMANQAALTILGYESLQDLFNINLEQNSSPSHYDRATFKKQIEEQGKVNDFISEVHFIDKETRYVRENSRAIYDQDGKIKFYEGTLENITPQIRIEKQFNALNNIFGLLKTDPEQNIQTIVNQSQILLHTDAAFYASYNNSTHRLQLINSHNIQDDMPIDIEADGSICYEENVKKGNEHTLIDDVNKTSYRETDWHVKHLKLRSYLGYPVKINNQIMGALCIVDRRKRKYTKSEINVIRAFSNAVAKEVERKENNPPIYEQDFQLSGLFDNLQDGIFLVTDNIITYANIALANILGIQSSELTGKSLFEFDHLYPGLVANYLTRIAGETLPRSYEYFLQSKSGNKYRTQITSILIKFRGKTAVLGSIKDISKQSIEETEPEKSKATLKEAVETKDKFFSIIAHDLKNPFNTIVGFSNLLYEEYDNFDDSDRKLFIKNINDASEQTYKLLDNLLEWSRAQRNMIEFLPQAIQLSSLVKQCISLFETSAIKKSIRIISEIPDDIQVFIDQNMIMAVLRNLVSNALKFSFPEGEIRITHKRERNMIHVLVKDNGVGIPKVSLNRLFHIDHHHKTEGTQGESGTGLGLLLSKEFVEKNGGLIQVTSKSGKGSTFSFSVPRFQLSKN